MGFEHYFQLHTHDGPSINSSGSVRFDSLARLEFFLLLIKPRRDEGNEKKMKNLLSLRPPLQYGPHGMNRIVCRSPQYYYRIFCVPSSVCKQKGTPAGSLPRAGRQIHDYIIPRLLPYDRILDRGISFQGPFRSVGWLWCWCGPSGVRVG